MKAALTLFLPTYMKEIRGESLWLAGISLSIIQFSGAIGTLFSGTLSDKIGRKPALLVIFISAPILMWLFLTFDGAFTIPLLILTGFFLFASGPVLLALVHDVKSDSPAFVNGVYMTLNFAMTSVTVMMVGGFGDWLGLEMTYKLTGLFALGSIPFVMMLSDKND